MKRAAVVALASTAALLLCLRAAQSGSAAQAGHAASSEPQAASLGHQKELFLQVFGPDVVRFDPSAVARARQATPENPVLIDSNGDGKVDTAYFIDTNPKHQPQFRPILVKVIDQDGDMATDGGGDHDSDLYVADWNADGTVDAVVEYRDVDHDNALDEMAIYTYSANNRNLGSDALQVWWSRDVGHDHRLWDTINYRYQQDEAQFRTHFGGDEIFSSYIFDAKRARWIPSWENPFVFYDEDGDQLAERTLRISGNGDRVTSIRYGTDADNDTAGENAHDYDFSYTCLAGDGANAIVVPDALKERVTLRGGPADPVLSWKHARHFGETAPWKSVLFTWVENDNNVDSRSGGDPHPRWEGVIASAFAGFPQVGGPPVGPVNARYELDNDNSGKLQLYYSTIDHRIHLRGAETAGLKIDYNYDGRVDAEFRYQDSDGDGVIDTWSVDADGDGTMDRSWHVAAAPIPLPTRYAEFTAFYRQQLNGALAANQALIDAMKTRLGTVDPAETYYARELIHYREPEGVGERIRKSPAAARLYQDLLRERYSIQLRPLLTSQERAAFDAAYEHGDYEAAARVLRSKPTVAEGTIISVTNPTAEWRLREPVSVHLPKMRGGTVVVTPSWIAERQIPSQWDGDDLLFLADVPPQSTARFRVTKQASATAPQSAAWGTTVFSYTASGSGVAMSSGTQTLLQPGELVQWGTVRASRIVSTGPVRSIIDVETSAGHQRITHWAAHPEFIVEGTGAAAFPALPRQKTALDNTAGIWASWSRENNVIQEVGRAAIFAPGSSSVHDGALTLRGSHPRYIVVGDWRLGRTFPVAPGSADWEKEVRALADRLRHPLPVQVRP